MMVYLASPIDQTDVYDRGRVKRGLAQVGFTVYDPSSPWIAKKPYDHRIRLLDLAAIDLADGVFVWWPAGLTSVGVPMEIQYAIGNGKPVAMVSAQEQIASAMMQLPDDRFKAYPLGFESEAAGWLEIAIEDARHNIEYRLYTARLGERVAQMYEVDIENSGSEPVSAGGSTLGDLSDPESPPDDEQVVVGGNGEHTVPFRLPLTINGVIKRVGKYMQEKGWLHDGRTFGDDIALMHSELSEALEEWRAGRAPNESYYEGSGLGTSNRKPCGIPSEFADLFIRLAGACNQWGIDLEAALREKLDYNDTRAARHGGKKL